MEVVDVRSEVPREIVDATVDTASLVASDTGFALDLFRALRAEGDGGNLFFSPHSVTVALGMAMAGARGDTYDQIAEALGVTGAGPWHARRNALDVLLLEERPRPPGSGELQPLELSIANSTWGQAGYPFRADYLDLLARHYGTGLRTVDFVAAPEESRVAVNDWVEDATEGRITDLVPEGAITGLTRLVLADAIFFKANWLHPFDQGSTRGGTFHTASGDDVTVPMVQQEVRLAYADGDGWAAARLPYVGAASMVLIAPDQGRVDDVAGSLDATTLRELTAPFDPSRRQAWSDHIVDLRMPRFEVASAVDLIPALQRLGIVDLFEPPTGDGGADLTGMTDARELFVSGAFHQASITVDEEGTEAAAATALVISRMSAPPRVALHVDRPFLFFIQDDRTGAILFAGVVADPGAA